ncbi:ribonuclease domain-containing protein [Butyrivibrio sp. INlla14]|uniref:ribonuclease domain-containing protein n=1 Tax=Butyrivibrio sp. INlla14 TaxID=1520808 RepID=UPI000876BA1A|nr:ribonuclease domain-containing protein [Butyrivibrio sp. INlla14]SCY05159.1 ribonuclease [Butyrivibrio sp. INlla14]
MKLKFKKTLLYVALLMALMLSLVGCSRKPKVVEPGTGAGAETSVEASNTVSGVASAQELSTVDNSSAVASEITTVDSSISVDNASVEDALPEDGTYNSKEDVALYIHIYGKLPSNFITKKEAKKLGWPGGSLEDYAPGKSIGGDYFGNYEGLLPAKEGRKYYECDIDTLGKSKRGAKRIIYSNDGLIFYTEDHYESFELLYGEP